jgi:hypothetical protein
MCGWSQADGATPLLFACRLGHFDVVDALLAAGASVNAATVCTFQALMRYLTTSFSGCVCRSQTLLLSLAGMLCVACCRVLLCT